MKIFDFFENNKHVKIDLYVDMDGVLAEYDIGNFNYLTIRPLTSIINKIEKISLMENVSVYVLSICKTNDIINDKIKWLNKYVHFIDEDKQIFISKEDIDDTLSSSDIKSNYLRNSTNKDHKIVFIDDDNRIIKNIVKNNKDVIVFQDSSLVD